jgi:hypothetical protein
VIALWFAVALVGVILIALDARDERDAEVEE